MRRRVGTLSELARRCSVNPSTVSRVLNNSMAGRFSVSSQVRKLIVDTAREINYRPNLAARNLTANNTNLVAVLGVAGMTPDRVGPVKEAITVLAQVLDEANYDICVQFSSKRVGRFDLPPLRVDGLIAVGAQTDADVAALDSLDIPHVGINGRIGKNGSSISPDDTRRTYIALKHLVDLGHRRIARLDHWVTFTADPSVHERHDAFLRVATELGVQCPRLTMPLLPASTAWDSYYEPFIRQTIIEGGATAVLAYSHQSALSLFRKAHDIGLRIPADFSLVCFINDPVLQLSVPSITAIDVSSSQMGHMAATILLRNMGAVAEMNPVHLHLDETLFVRESSGPPKVS